MTKGEQRDERRRERTQKTLEKYEAKKALIAEWENIDPEYTRRLRDQAHKLKETLVVKGVLLPVEMDL